VAGPGDVDPELPAVLSRRRTEVRVVVDRHRAAHVDDRAGVGQRLGRLAELEVAEDVGAAGEGDEAVVLDLEASVHAGRQIAALVVGRLVVEGAAGGRGDGPRGGGAARGERDGEAARGGEIAGGDDARAAVDAAARGAIAIDVAEDRHRAQGLDGRRVDED